MMLEGLIKEITANMIIQIKLLESENVDRKTILGNIGQLFVGRALKYSLNLGLGFAYNDSKQPSSYCIEQQYGANKDGRHGVDFKVDIVDSLGKQYVFLVEVKNWGDYNITPAIFHSEILSRFESVDSDHAFNWMVTLNEVHSSNVRELCFEHNIEIIPLEGQITPEQLLELTIEPAIRSFVNNYVYLIRHHLNLRYHRDAGFQALSNPDKIRYFLRLGVPENIIASKYGMSIKYVWKLKSDMVKHGKEVIVRRGRRYIHYKRL